MRTKESLPEVWKSVCSRTSGDAGAAQGPSVRHGPNGADGGTPLVLRREHDAVAHDWPARDRENWVAVLLSRSRDMGGGRMRTNLSTKVMHTVIHRALRHYAQRYPQGGSIPARGLPASTQASTSSLPGSPPKDRALGQLLPSIIDAPDAGEFNQTMGILGVFASFFAGGALPSVLFHVKQHEPPKRATLGLILRPARDRGSRLRYPLRPKSSPQSYPQ
jgi:hypothetical protein